MNIISSVYLHLHLSSLVPNMIQYSTLYCTTLYDLALYCVNSSPLDCDRGWLGAGKTEMTIVCKGSKTNAALYIGLAYRVDF